MENVIEITGADLKEVIKAVYDLSAPQGMGFLHYKDEPLSDNEINEIIDRHKNTNHLAISIDYLNGRSCKFHVFKDGEKLFIHNKWYDHTDAQLNELLRRI